MAAPRRTRFVELFWRIHPHVYRWTGGRVGGEMMGMPVLLLTTRGRRSGRSRTSALMYLPLGESRVVVASHLGEPRHPAWWLNLCSEPAAELQIGKRRLPVRAREAEGEERARLWEQIVERQPDYAEYQRRTDRRIPVVVLEPRPGT